MLFSFEVTEFEKMLFALDDCNITCTEIDIFQDIYDAVESAYDAKTFKLDLCEYEWAMLADYIATEKEICEKIKKIYSRKVIVKKLDLITIRDLLFNDSSIPNYFFKKVAASFYNQPYELNLTTWEIERHYETISEGP